MALRFSQLRQLLLIGSLFTLTACSHIVGVTQEGPITEDYGTRTWGAYIDDNSIETKTKVNLRKASPALREAHILVHSYNGVLLLAGQVDSQSYKQQAGEIANAVRKVRRLHNELTVGPPSSTGARISDTWISHKIGNRLLFTKGIESGRIQVITEHGTVFLMGLVTRDEGNRVVDAIKKVSGVQKIVKIFEYIDDGQVF